jgi:hypothetical protein
MFAFTNTNGISRMHMHYHAFHYSDRVFLQHTTAWTRIVAAMVFALRDWSSSGLPSGQDPGAISTNTRDT